MAMLTSQHPTPVDVRHCSAPHASELAPRAFDRCIALPSRVAKPRNQGLTSVLDKGMSELYMQDYLEDAAPYIDLVEFGWGTSRLFSAERLRTKIETLCDYDIRVSPGGTLTELAVVQHCVPDFFRNVVDFGFTGVEVAEGVIEMPLTDKLCLIRMARQMGLEVVSTMRESTPAERQNVQLNRRIAQALAELEAGAWKVRVKRSDGNLAGVEIGDHTTQESDVDALVQAIGLEHLIFAAPQKSQQIKLCKQYGNQVNLGHIAPENVIPVETFRIGLHEDTLRVFHEIVG